MTANYLCRSFIPGLFCIFLLPFVASGQAQPAPNGNQPQIKTVFDAYTNAFFQEKMYVHTDKDSYLSGETVFMRAYRMDAMTHNPQVYSGIFYAEIRNPENQLMERMLIVKSDSGFQATYKIPTDISSGYYELVAYTNMMQNYDEAFYFKKRFYIYNAADNNVVAKIEYAPEIDKNNISANLKMISSDGEPYQGATVDITPFSGNTKQTTITRNMDRDGSASFGLRHDAAITGLEVSFQEEKPLKYRKYFKMPIFADSIDVQFMPEGGHLLNGQTQQVGFKAIAADGNGVNISGNVQDSLGNTVGFFQSSHLGMGSFILEPKAGMNYRAEVTTDDGRTAMFNLPQVADTGVAISATLRGDVLTCRVLSTDGFDFSDLYFGFHCRGKSYGWVALDGPNAFRLPVASLPDGIVHFFIVNTAGDVFSERLVFINKDHYPKVKVTGLKDNYGRRSKVEVGLNVLYNDSIPMASEMSVSVVDPNTTVVDRNENILSYVMLSSDIKGKIENPAYYFNDSIPNLERMRNADFLMMTQGWKRFDIGSILRGERPEMPFAVEIGQNVSGTIKPLWRKTTDSGSLLLLGTNPNAGVTIFRDVQAEDSGQFFVNGLSFPRGTTFLVQGLQKGKKTNVEVIVEKQVFRGLSADRLAGRTVYHPEAEVVDTVANFLKSSGRKYFYENGERIYAMDEVVVTASRKDADPERAMYDDVASRSITGQELVEEGYPDLRSWLEANGVEVRMDENSMDETAYIRNRRASVALDYLPVTRHEEFLRLPMQDIDKIWVIRDPVSYAMVTSNATSEMDQGGIIIRTKSGMGLASGPRRTLSFFQFTPIGYSAPDAFYSPKYDGTDDKKMMYDERTTVHWEPSLKTGADGKTSVSFYTTDVPTDLLMIIQGMSLKGMPIYTVVPVKSSF